MILYDYIYNICIFLVACFLLGFSLVQFRCRFPPLPQLYLLLLPWRFPILVGRNPAILESHENGSSQAEKAHGKTSVAADFNQLFSKALLAIPGTLLQPEGGLVMLISESWIFFGYFRWRGFTGKKLQKPIQCWECRISAETPRFWWRLDEIHGDDAIG